MAATCIWMVSDHHPLMCFFNLICWSALSNTQYESCFSPSHGSLETAFIKLFRQIPEIMPSLYTIFTSISCSSHSKSCHKRCSHDCGARRTGDGEHLSVAYEQKKGMTDTCARRLAAAREARL
uniref:Secreted protein n=1 Tax=Lotus japonicus TaxID=34305 RepID=I3T8L7_LOTJA|nr:unknown [Lotus japonicus]